MLKLKTHISNYYYFFINILYIQVSQKLFYWKEKLHAPFHTVVKKFEAMSEDTNFNTNPVLYPVIIFCPSFYCSNSFRAGI